MHIIGNDHITRLKIFLNPKKYSPVRRIGNEKIIFIHINKTAGTSIAKSIGLPFKMHYTCKEIIDIVNKKDWDEAYKFTVVRNPWDRVVSHYKYRLKTNQTGLGAQPISFKDWIRHTYSEEKNPKYYNNPKMFQQQIEWIKDYNNNVCVNKIIRFENIENEYNFFAEQIGISNRLPHLNKTKHEDYKKYYDDETISIIQNWFRDDIELWGYTFE
ncbi:sulfotransferase family 2 domain-containing protein [uncultured Draconibacterium sp.]|uniref:sulfotransferase family 2 domain-containing protein n=1 Tax=uncultured Draconibacterium sp. TaxID=1573823 RepID=UPI0032180788